MIFKSSLEVKQFRELLYQAFLDSRPEIRAFQDKLKKQYKKAWGQSEFLDKRLAREYTNIIVNKMIDIEDDQEEG